MANNPLSLNKTARALIMEGENILFCREKKGKLFFLPGWDIALGEESEKILNANVSNELEAKIKNFKYIGAISQSWRIDKFSTNQHFDIYYFVELHNKVQPKKDEGIEFFWQKLEAIDEDYLHPKVLKSKIIEWFSERKAFWASV